MNIYLIGMMASGKSRVGRILAARLKWRWFDLDHVIEERVGESVEEIFAVHGEKHFRFLEVEAMRELMKLEKTVISTGGGTPCQSDLMSGMIDSGVTVYLQATPKILVQRLVKDEVVRPLLSDLTPMAMEDSVSELIRKRKVFYDRASLKVNADQSSEQIVQDVLTHVGGLQSK